MAKQFPVSLETLKEIVQGLTQAKAQIRSAANTLEMFESLADEPTAQLLANAANRLMSLSREVHDLYAVIAREAMSK